MKARIKKKWLKALRSGEYEQGQSQLRDTKNQFCCLGVLCNLHAQEHPEIAAQQRKPGLYMGALYYLPDEVAKWAGLRDLGGDEGPEEGHIQHTLARMNDQDKTFLAIAKYIEENL